MALEQRPLILSEVLVRKDQSVYAALTVAADTTVALATPLNSSDGGLTWNILTTPLYEDGTYTTGDNVYFAGHIYESLIDANDVLPNSDPAKWEDQGVWNANGVLLEYADVTGDYEVMTSGYLKAKNMPSIAESLRPVLFDNNIILK